jgi:hypothetical protein
MNVDDEIRWKHEVINRLSIALSLPMQYPNIEEIKKSLAKTKMKLNQLQQKQKQGKN